MHNIKIIIINAVIVTAIAGSEIEFEEDDSEVSSSSMIVTTVAGSEIELEEDDSEVSGMAELSIGITGNWNHMLLTNTDD